MPVWNGGGMSKRELSPFEQISLLPEIAAETSEAIAAVGEASEEWGDWAIEALQNVATDFERFTGDEVWAELTAMGCDVEPSDARAMGAVFQRARAEGWIVRVTGVFRVSTRRTRHLGPMGVWESKIYRGGGRDGHL